jgi:hypothetical protein
VVSAGLFVRSFQAARRINPGFEPGHVLVAHLSLDGYTVPERKQFMERLRDRVSSQPGVTGVTYAQTVPMAPGQWWESLEIQSYVPGTSKNMKIVRNVVAPGYFDMLRIPIVEGRDFTGHDDENPARKARRIQRNSPHALAKCCYQRASAHVMNPGRKDPGSSPWNGVMRTV